MYNLIIEERYLKNLRIQKRTSNHMAIQGLDNIKESTSGSSYTVMFI